MIESLTKLQHVPVKHIVIVEALTEEEVAKEVMQGFVVGSLREAHLPTPLQVQAELWRVTLQNRINTQVKITHPF